MYCGRCGTNVPEGAKFCPSCGAELSSRYTTANGSSQEQGSPYRNQSNPYQYQNRQYQNDPYQSGQYRYTQEQPGVSFPEAIKRFFTHYADFSGRSRRSEYWYVILFNMIVSTVLTAVFKDANGISIVASLWSIAILIPSLALCVRRLHDAGKGGVWLLWILLPIAGPIILLVQYCKDSEPGANQYGPSPKYP